MVVGIGILTIRIHESRSLKAKRSVVRSMVRQIRNHFNASVAETGLNDVYQEAEIGVALVGNSRSVINAKLDKIINFAESLGIAELIDSELEIFNL